MKKWFFLFSCMVLCATPAFLNAETVIIAHRGASGLAPENTLASFAKAVEFGAEYFELDVQLSSDDSLMIMHDDTIDRTTSGNGALVTKTYDQLRAVDAGSWFSPAFSGEKIPTLSEALDLALAAPYRVGVVIEIKAATAGIVEKTVAAVQRRSMQDRVIISSFNLSQITQSKQIDPSIPVHLFATITATHISQVAAIKGEWVGSGGAITKALIDLAHAQNIRMNKWTVNSASEMRTLINLGVDAITTNFPDVARALLDLTPPTDVVLLPPTVSASRIHLTWQPSSDPESGIAGYEIYRDTTAHAATLLRSLGDTTAFTDETHSESKQYFYRIKAKNNGGLLSANFSNEVSATTEKDEQAPQIRSVRAFGRTDQMIILFDERLDKTSAETTVNYQITPGITVLSARLALDLQSVFLGVSPLLENTAYALAVTGVQDLAALPNAIMTPATAAFTFTPFLPNTVAFWDLDEAEGDTMHDCSGNNNQGSLMNDLGWGAGHCGNGLVFDGVNDYAAIPSSTSLDINTNAVSISLWTRLELLPNDLPGSYGPLYDSDTDNYVLYEDKGTNELRFKVTTDKSAERPGIPASDLKTGEWLHVVGVYDGSQAMIFLNGQLRDTHPLTGIVRAKQRATIGASAGSFLRGAIDDIQIFSRALTMDEIYFLYTGEKSASHVEKQHQQPEQSRLQQNYPNPFNASTTFRYTVSNRDRIKLSVYDVCGREVAVLEDKVLDDGNYEARWDGHDRAGLPACSGVYFCRMTTPYHVLTRKLLLVR